MDKDLDRNWLSRGAAALCLALCAALVPSTASAQSGEPIGSFLSTLSAFQGKSGPEIAPKVSAAVYADDPAMEDKIGDLYSGSNVAVPATPASAPPVAPAPSAATLDLFPATVDTADATSSEPALPPEYLAAVDKFLANIADATLQERMRASYLLGIEGITPQGQPVPKASGRSDSAAATGAVPVVGGCTVSAAVEATAPFKAYLIGRFDHFIQTTEIAEYYRGSKQGLEDQVVSVGTPSLPMAYDLDRTFGSTYWTNRWHAHAGRGGVSIARAEHVLYGVIDAGRSEAERADVHALAAIAPFFSAAAEERRNLLGAIRTLIADLRARDCGGHADFVHALAAHDYAIGGERAEYEQIAAGYWNAYGLYQPRPDSIPQWLTYVRSDVSSLTYGEVSDSAADSVLGDLRVSDVLGPLPPPVVEEAYAGEDGTGEAPYLDLAEDSQGIDADQDAGGEDAEPASDGTADDSWEDPSKLAGRAAPSQNAEGGENADGTWLSAAGIGTWPQDDLAGFWKTAGVIDAEGQLTLVTLSDDTRHFDGQLVKDGALTGPWIVMDRDGDSHGWRGEIGIAQFPIPPGYCPRWTKGAFLTPPGAAIINGAWTARKVDIETCKESDEPDQGRVSLERVVATSFKPLIPGKYIHLLGVPAGGSTAAQYQAAVKFACSTAGFPAVEPRVTSSGGKIVAGAEPCSYELVVDRPGSYDITVAFHGTDGKLVHRDQLRADVPPIPGLMQ